ncbi:hypothetical protein HZA38_02265 [Candidatus Peregrinibacteria bacterium]|nr:hypothetical protein [Candidatus Peregrinibacteria bacterium]
MKYSYVAINNEYQKVTGLITAENLDEAKMALHKMGLSVLTVLEDLSPNFESMDANVQSFWFSCRDQQGKETSGTIEATDRKNAYRRLIAEYNFEVFALCDALTPENDRLQKGAMGLKELEESVQMEFGITPVHHGAATTEAEDILNLASENFIEAKKRIQQEVDIVLERSREILEKYREKISNEEYATIEESMDTLMHMKLSTNLGYIEQLSDELFETIHRIITRYEQGDLHESENVQEASPEEDSAVDAIVGSVQKKSVQNASALGKLKLTSQRLSRLLKKGEAVIPQQKVVKSRLLKNLDRKKSFRGKRFRDILSIVDRMISTRSSARRRQKLHEFFEYISRWYENYQKLQRNRKEKKEKAKKIALENKKNSIGTKAEVHSQFFLIEEIHDILGFLFGFSTLFLLISIFMVQKRIGISLAVFYSFFSNSFLIIIFLFVFLLNGNLMIWHEYCEQKRKVLAFSSVISISGFLLFLMNV